MGTNYYLRRDFCPCCGQSRQELYIGKQCVGWRFLAHVYKDGMSFEEYKDFLKTGVIFDEYGKQIAYDDMINNILQFSGNQKLISVNSDSWKECDYVKNDFC